MNKKEAANHLGISERSLNRYAEKGLIKPTYVRGGRGEFAIYDDNDIEKLKEHLSTPREQTSLAPVAKKSLSPLAMSGLDKVPDLLRIIADRLEPRPTVVIENKLTLSLAEASVLSGLSQNFLSESIHSKKLKAAKRGRGWNIKRSDLDLFIKKL